MTIYLFKKEVDFLSTAHKINSNLFLNAKIKI